MSTTDGIVRIIVALVIAGMWYANIISGVLLIVLAVIAAIFIITGFMNFCPLYAAFGLRTRQKEKD